MATSTLLALLTVSTRLDPLLGKVSTPVIGLAGDNATQARFSAPPPNNSSLAAAAAMVSSGVAFPAEFVAHGTQWTREPAMGLISRTCSLDGMMGALKQSQWAKPRATVGYFIDPAIRFIEELLAFNAFNRDKDGALSILIVLHWFLTNPRLWLFVVTSAVHIFIISCTKIPKLIARAANRRRKKTDVVLPAAGAATEEEAASAEAAGERLVGILRIRGGMGAGASALTDESPDADIKAAYEGASAQERSAFLVDAGEQHKRKLVSLGLDVPEAAPSGLTPGTPLPPKLRQALTELDKIVIQVLLHGAIRLLCVKWLLMQPANFKMPNRQALEELEESGASPSPLLSPQEAAALVGRGDRSIGALTYGWLSPGDPDPDGSRIRVLRRALKGMAIRIEALFWDFGSLYQNPRTPGQEEAFVIALKGGAMNQLYASILATTVLQIEEIPPRPAEFDGVVCLFKLSANVDENKVRAALIGFGTIESCDLSYSPPIVRFASHASAVAAKDAGAWPGLCEGLDTLYNETPYFSRGW
jgi:hypothetical protein